ncbi:MAG: pyruvate dehydrogenase (acetyl-transferring) E1 component subunit alpha [Bacilli bacterium]|nr:pyruvate dehydrogenase (acetyl-transferring) E1 component subunit alpha [Acholeplasmataceae bacterium]
MLFKKYDPLKKKVFRVLGQEGKIVNKDYEPAWSDEELLAIYRQMALGRIADIKAIQFQRQGRMLTFVPNQGQEAAQIGPMLALKKTDWLVPGFREFNALLAHGLDLETAYLYWYGNEMGSKYPENVRALPVNIIIGTQINHAVGLAYARRLKNTDEVVITFIGDGGTSHGEFHEGMNFGAVLDAPLIAVIQNNQWAISTPRAKATKSETLAQKAIAYGIPGIQVDGNDLFAMHAATKEAAERARRGEGPTLIEALTYRLGAHTTSDNPDLYRSEEETAEWLERDPLKRFRIYLTEKGLWDDDREEKLQAELNDQVLEAFKKVEARGAVAPEDIFRYTYEKMTPELEKQLRSLREYLAREAQ